MKSNIPAEKLLDQLITENRLKSTVDNLLAEIRETKRQNGPKSFYEKILETDGLQAAEAALEEWSKEQHWREFSEAIEKIAIGMRDLATADKENKYCSVVFHSGETKLPFPASLSPNTHLIIAQNPEWHGCGCNTPTGSDIFGKFGVLGFKAAVLILSSSFKVKLALMFQMLDSDRTIPSDGYTTFIINSNGLCLNSHNMVGIYSDSYLQYSLGLISVNEILCHCAQSGGYESMYLGFPGSFDYLARHIHLLGPYLSGMATHLTEHAQT